MRSTLSILGLYNYDTSIFENFVVPAGVNAADAVNSIVMDNAELELLYPEPDTIKFMIGLWSKRELPVWERIFRVINMEYNPIENYNRNETWTDTEEEDTSASTTISNSVGGNSTRTPNLSETHKVTGYNDFTLTTSSQDDSTGTESISNTQTESGSETGSGSRDKTTTRTGNVSGNIGVVTSQRMLLEEIGLAPETDIYKYISESFKKRFCLMVY